jgi:hypothetical protein
MSLNVGDNRSRLVRGNLNQQANNASTVYEPIDYVLESSIVTKENVSSNTNKSSEPTSLFLNSDLVKLEEQKKAIAKKDLIPDSVNTEKVTEPVNTEVVVSTTTAINEEPKSTDLQKYKTYILVLAGIVVAYVVYKKSRN